MVSGNGTTVIFLEGLLTLSNVHEKVIILETIESRKLGLNRFFSYINIPDKFLA